MPGVAARGWLSLATRSGRGGTTGRAAGCPARGLEGGLAVPSMEAATGAGGVRITGAGLPRRGADGRMLSPLPGGNGWRGPDNTWPGRNGGSGLGGGGTGRLGAMAGACGVGAGAMGCGGTCGTAGAGGPGSGELGPASGGRMGCDGRLTGAPGICLSGAGSGAVSSRFTVVLGAAGATSGGGKVSTASDSRSWNSSGTPSDSACSPSGTS